MHKPDKHESERAQDLLERARTALTAPPDPEFNYAVGWAEDYEPLFAAEYTETTAWQSLLDVALRHGRVVLSGRGGSGKTIVMIRIARLALQNNILPVSFDLRAWTTLDYENWKGLADDAAAQLSYLFERFSQPRLGLYQLDALPADFRKLFLLDGLNEISSVTGGGVLRAMGRAAAQILGAASIISDRLVRRRLDDPTAWRLARLLPLTSLEVARVLGSRAKDTHAQVGDLLQIPFFLADALEHDVTGAAKTEAMRNFFARHALTAADTTAAAAASYQCYSDQSRVFRCTIFEATAGAQVLHKLLTSGVVQHHLLADPDFCHFQHHLLHDYLAALHVASQQGLWRDYDALNKLTFRATSFDALGFIIDLLPPDSAALFARDVYDWNSYGAAYVVSESLHGGRVPLGREMRRVIFAAMAEKSCDLMTATAQRGSDALAMVGDPDAQALRGIHSIETVVDVVSGWTTNDKWFLEWKALFTSPRTNRVQRETLERISDTDSIIGWTLANVLKRIDLQPQDQEWLRQTLLTRGETASAKTQWRIVHVLGGWPDEDNLKVVLSLLADPRIQQEVHYGATRSLVEMAAVAREPSFRKLIFQRLVEQRRQIARFSGSIAELRSSLNIDPGRAPADWRRAALPLIEAFYESAETDDNAALWMKVAYDLDARYSDAPR